MSSLAIFLADGFEEIEGLTVVDVCRRADLEITMVSVGQSLTVTGSHGIAVTADKWILTRWKCWSSPEERREPRIWRNAGS